LPLETATFISDLTTSNPGHSDGLSQADSHLRLIKATLKNTFPNFTSAALASTQAQIDAVVNAAPAVTAYLVPPGAMVDFGGTTAPTGWLACDGAAISRTTFSNLFTALGTTWGAGDGSTTFNVPNLGNRFRRHRAVGSLAGAVGTLQSPTNLTHTHGVSGTTDPTGTDHTHSGTTSAMSANANHSHTVPYVAPNANSGTGGGAFSCAGPIANVSTTTSAVNLDHSHTFTTGGMSANHAHTFSVTSGATGDTNEARPYAATVLTCIKT
jgi:microcystin-dependent protein